MFEKHIEKCFSELYSHVNGAILFLDNEAAECIHWHRGLTNLLQRGALNVKELTFLEKDEEAEKAVFITTSLLKEEVLFSIKEIIKASHFNSCTVITSTTSEMHNMFFQKQGNEMVENQYFMTIQHRILEWMDNKSGKAEVLSSSIFMARIAPSFYILPSFSQLFRIVDTNQTGSAFQDFRFLTKNLASSLNRLFEEAQVKEDIFTIGNLSNLVGMELENLSSAKTRRKNSSNKVSLIIADRTLDLTSASSVNFISLLDKIVNSLKPLPNHHCDVSVSMAPLFDTSVFEMFGMPFPAPGCLVNKSEVASDKIFKSMLFKKQKETLMELNRTLLENQKKEGLKIQAGSKFKISSEALLQRALSFKAEKQVLYRNLGLIQQTLAVVQSLEADTSESEIIQSLQQHFLQTIVNNPESLFEGFLKILETKIPRELSLPSYLLILVYVLSIKEYLLKPLQLKMLEVKLAEALCANCSDLPSYLTDCVDDSRNIEHWQDFASKFLMRIINSAKVRSPFKDYRNLIRQESELMPVIQEPLLVRLMHNILSSEQPDSPDLVYQTNSLTDILMNGFNMFMQVNKKPTPRDNPVIILLVLGGITASEVYQISQVTKKYPTPEVIIMATNLTKSTDLLTSFTAHI